jgi:hypothetical protein
MYDYVDVLREYIMKKREVKIDQSNYVAVALAEEVELARDYVEMLRNNDIMARFVVNNEVVDGGHVTIMVAEECVMQAQLLIEIRSSGDDFCEYVYGDDLADQFEEKEG